MAKILRFFKENFFVSTALLYIMSSFIIKGISFFTTPVFTRLMSTADFGIVSNFHTWEQVFASFICLQASSSLLAAKTNYAHARFHSFLKSIILFSLGTATILSLLVCFLSYPISSFTKLSISLIPLVCISALGLSMINLCSNYYIAINNPKNKVIFSLTTCLITVVSSLCFVFFMSDKSFGRILGFVVSYICIIIFAVIFFTQEKTPSKNFFLTDIKYALSFGVPLIPHLLANLVTGSSDKIFIIRLCGESANGIYSLAYNIGQLALVFASACADAWNPWYYNETKNKGSKKRIADYFYLYTITIGMCFVGVMLLAPEIMKIMAPKEYWSGTRCILFVAVGIFLLFMYRFPLAYEQYNSKTIFVAPATIMSAIINVFFNSVLIPKYGIEGAAIATSISYACILVFHEFVARVIIKGYNISLYNYIIPLTLVILAFILSNVMIHSGFASRFLLLVVICGCYMAYILFFFKFKQK